MKIIDPANWPRKPHYDFYSSFDFPQYNICCEMDLSHLSKALPNLDVSLFQAVLWCVSDAANQIEPFRYRIREADVVCHDAVHPSFTVLQEDQTFGFCEVRYTHDQKHFFREVARRIQEAKREPSLEDGPGRDDYLYISCLPWIHFTSISHPIKLDHTDAIPRITWGKVREEKIRTQLPISVQVHHGLVDGLHVAQFIERLQSLLDEFHIEYAK